MISPEEAKYVHDELIKNFGGSNGIRDITALQSALIRPFQVFENNELYPDVLSKASALIESIISNHPFIDGNKRTGYVLMRLFLISNNIDIAASENDKFNFVISIASGRIKYNEILQWLQDHTSIIDR